MTFCNFPHLCGESLIIISFIKTKVNKFCTVFQELEHEAVCLQVFPVVALFRLHALTESAAHYKKAFPSLQRIISACFCFSFGLEQSLINRYIHIGIPKSGIDTIVAKHQANTLSICFTKLGCLMHVFSFCIYTFLVFCCLPFLFH